MIVIPFVSVVVVDDDDVFPFLFFFSLSVLGIEPRAKACQAAGSPRAATSAPPDALQHKFSKHKSMIIQLIHSKKNRGF